MTRSIITSEQRANLVTLATYLRGELSAGFDMWEYYRPRRPIVEHPGPECETVRCAAGHGPLAGIPLWHNGHEGWSTYTARAFGANVFADLDGLYAWIFDGL